MGIAIVVENDISSPFAGLLARVGVCVAGVLGVANQGDLIDLEELKLIFVYFGAIALAGSEVSGSPAVVGAVPALFVDTALALVVPAESDLGASRGLCSVGRWSGILVSDDVGAVNLVAHDRLVAPALVGLPSRRVCWKGIIDGSTAEASVGLAANLSALYSSVAGDLGDKAREENSSVEDLGHFGGSCGCEFGLEQVS